MKKTFLILAVIFATTFSISLAQPRAIGGRAGFGFGASYQHSLHEKNMLQVDLDAIAYQRYRTHFGGVYRMWGLQAVATYNWVFPVKSWKGVGSWNWYTGVGGGMGMVTEGWDYEINLGVAGMIAVEYNFKFPLQLSFDLRPVVGPCYLVQGKSFFISLFGIVCNSASIGIRYKF